LISFSLLQKIHEGYSIPNVYSNILYLRLIKLHNIIYFTKTIFAWYYIILFINWYFNKTCYFIVCGHKDYINIFEMAHITANRNWKSVAIYSCYFSKCQYEIYFAIYSYSRVILIYHIIQSISSTTRQML